MFRRPRQQDEKHLKFVRSLPCVVCGDNTRTEAAHIRVGATRVAKRPTGKGEKPDDCWVVPLCWKHHHQQHHDGERVFWPMNNIDPIYVALALYRVSGDHEAGELIVHEWSGLCAFLAQPTSGS